LWLLGRVTYSAISHQPSAISHQPSARTAELPNA
jgi:hypothetical protein